MTLGAASSSTAAASDGKGKQLPDNPGSNSASAGPMVFDVTPSLSVVIPALAEGPNLELLLPQLKVVLDEIGAPYEVFIVTSELDDLTLKAAKLGDATVIQQVERGYGGALLAGFAASRGQYVLTMDADLSHPPAFVADLWGSRSGADVTVASRYVKGGRAIMPRSRYILSRTLNLVFRRGLGLAIQDLSSGFRIYRGDSVKDLRLRSRDFDILLEILVKSHLSGLRVAEIPFIYQPRQHGSSHARLLKFGIAYVRTFRHLRRAIAENSNSSEK
jgi:dolichol-phosphate mannosyltransferase